MRKSREVPLTVLAALAMCVTGCHETNETRNCVDAQGRIAPDTRCDDDYSANGGNPVNGGNATYGGYHYIYGGSSGGHIGDAVIGGSTTSSMSSEGGVSRGGFGHAGGGEGGGE